MDEQRAIDQKKILAIIGAIWKDYPTLRLCQLLLNPIDHRNPYYTTDTELMTDLHEWYEANK